MIIVMKKNATEEQISDVIKTVEEKGLKSHLSKGVEVTIIGIIGDERKFVEQDFILLNGVENVIRILKPYKLAGRDFHPKNTVINIEGVKIGEEEVIIMAGPCAIEKEEQIMKTARAVKKEGGKILRGGAFKPRTSPYSFQGLGEEGLKLMKKAKEETGLLLITEVMDTNEIDVIAKYIDILQIGARNFQNYKLLKAVGNTRIPVLLKRGFSGTIKELLMCAEYILAEGNENIILCERGIRTFEDSTRFTLDLNAVPLLKKLTHLPVFVDPSHGTGDYELVIPMARAAVAAGADGLIVEVHPNPREALSDGYQTLTFEKFHILMKEISKIASVIGRYIQRNENS
ncbi:MAG TPA: 3-deoxy-7-phosphoheptulonate synthase [Candidatus Eremiobacteraeota bacterium]|nr:MAG: Phospho-2-dehydro-3-deoxyheptonate aldolase [bacterium ADurb.Bin363]HPZ09634.1 3-deoxy-7-phosphoheptulonate synthase [Candidatus Eremiobacteraeota bacterium]